VFDRFILPSSEAIRQAMGLNDLDLGLLCSHFHVPMEGLTYTWCSGFMEALEGRDLAEALKEAKGSPPSSWAEVEVVVELGAEGREHLRMLRSSS